MRKLYKNFLWGLTGEPQFMVVENGLVVARDPAVTTPETEEATDLQGCFILPAFIDAHCHILPTGLDLQKLHLGECTTHEEVLHLLRERLKDLGPTDWLMAVHYDQTKYPGGEHMNRRQLDGISTSRPILLRHVNGHASVVNTACLAAAGVDRNTRDPKGGTFLRDEYGELSGVLLETAHEQVTNAAQTPNLEQMVDAILQAGEKMSRLGIGCATDMMTGRYDLDLELQAYRIAAQRGCKVRTRLYLQWSAVFGPRSLSGARLAELSQPSGDDCRVAGIKIFADGAIGSATAAIYGYFEGTESEGQLIYAPDRLKSMVLTAHEAGYSLAIHSIGDRSTDLVMDAYSQFEDASHHRIEHAMILSDAQIERMAKLGIHCTMQPEFLMRFGHAYKRQLGTERASRLKRFRSVINAGIPMSFNSDRPIVGGDPWDGILTAERRPVGFDQTENITRQEAIYASTEMGSVANRDPMRWGSLQQGQPAVFQLYQEDPMTSVRPRPVF